MQQKCFTLGQSLNLRAKQDEDVEAMDSKTPTLESPLNSKEIKPVNPKGNQPRIFIGRTDAKAEAPILWPPDAKN